MFLQFVWNFEFRASNLNRMPSVNVYNVAGEVISTRELPAAVFAVPVNHGLLQLAVVAQRANRRVAVAHTKTRGEVRGGGRKPWRQKGTGRARHGSIRSPLWIGGGVVFGPRSDRNYQRKLNRRARRQALLQSLSAKVASQTLRLVDDLTPLQGKTKAAAGLLQKLQLRPATNAAAGGSPPKATRVAAGGDAEHRPSARRAAPTVLVVLPTRDSMVRAFRNLPRVAVTAADSLNVVDLLGHQYLLTSQAGLEQLLQVYGPTGGVNAAR